MHIFNHKINHVLFNHPSDMFTTQIHFKYFQHFEVVNSCIAMCDYHYKHRH